MRMNKSRLSCLVARTLASSLCFAILFATLFSQHAIANESDQQLSYLDQIFQLIEKYAVDNTSKLTNQAGDIVKRERSQKTLPETFVSTGVSYVMYENDEMYETSGYSEFTCVEEHFVTLTEEKPSSEQGIAFERELENLAKQAEQDGETFRIQRSAEYTANQANEFWDIILHAQQAYPRLRIVDFSVGDAVYIYAAIIDEQVKSFFKRHVINESNISFHSSSLPDVDKIAEKGEINRFPYADKGKDISFSWASVDDTVKYVYQITNVKTKKVVRKATTTKAQGLLPASINTANASYRIDVSAYDKDGLTIRQYLSFVHCGDKKKLAPAMTGPMRYDEVANTRDFKFNTLTISTKNVFERDTLYEDYKSFPSDEPIGYTRIFVYAQYQKLKYTFEKFGDATTYRYNVTRLSDNKTIVTGKGAYDEVSESGSITIAPERLTEIGIYRLRITSYNAENKVCGGTNVTFAIDRRNAQLTAKDYAAIRADDCSGNEVYRASYVRSDIFCTVDFGDHRASGTTYEEVTIKPSH